MRTEEYYANRAIKVCAKIKNFSLDKYDDVLDEIIKVLIEKDIDTGGSLLDSYIDEENSKVYLYLLNKGETLVYSTSVPDNYPIMRVGEYKVFDKDIANLFNEKDIYGEKDFKKEDEIKIGGISHLTQENNVVIRYRLDTYLVDELPVNIEVDFTKDE